MRPVPRILSSVNGYHRISARRGQKHALIAVAHSQLTAAYLILSTGARYHELGAQYMQAKIEKKRKLNLTAELKKLGYKVSLEKKRKQYLETTLS